MSVIISLFKMFISLLKIPFFLFCGFIVLWLFCLCCFVGWDYIKGRRFKQGERRRIKDSGLLHKIFVEAPRQFADDLYSREPDFFKYQGLILYIGRQGMGKTVSMVRDILMIQKEYPLCKCITNFDLKTENTALKRWEQLIDYKNGIYGVIVGIDEIQNWFSSKQSKDFPVEMFEVVTQNRKNRRVIFGTTQNFYQPAKDIRAQCTEVRKCFTILGVFTIVHAMRPVLDGNGDVKDWKHVKFYCFVHTKEIRDSYDTYKVIESLAKTGFAKKQSATVVNYYSAAEGKNVK